MYVNTKDYIHCKYIDHLEKIHTMNMHSQQNKHCSRLSMRLVLVIFLLISLSDCRNSYGGGPSAHGALGGQQLSATPTDFLDENTRVDVPSSHREAAISLVAQALDPATSIAAVREILTRAGIRIINSNGQFLNTPAIPSKIGVTIYDFQVPILAENIREGKTVGLGRVADLSQALFDVELPEPVLAEVVASWIKSAPYEQENPEAFDAALLQELSYVLPADLAEGQIHLLSFLVLSADIYGSKGTYRSPSTPTSFFKTTLEVKTAYATTTCPPDSYDPWDGVNFKSGKTIVDWIVDLFGDNWSLGKDVWKSGGKAYKATEIVEMLNSTLARAALVAGLKIEMSNNAASKELHLRHSSGGSDMNPVTFTTTVRFETPWPGATVQCGPMKGYSIPDNSTVSGVWVEWSLIGNYLETLDKQSSEKLSRGGGGGSYTDSNGKVELRAETVAEPKCPNDQGRPVDKLKCGKGTVKRASTGAEARLDLTKTPPLKFKDLIMGPDPVFATGKALSKVLTDIATDIATSARPARSTVNVAWHEGGEHVWLGTINIKKQKDVISNRNGPWFTAHAMPREGKSQFTEKTAENSLYRATIRKESCPEFSVCTKDEGEAHYKFSAFRYSKGTLPIYCRSSAAAILKGRAGTGEGTKINTYDYLNKRKADGPVNASFQVEMSREDNTWHIKANVYHTELACASETTEHFTQDLGCGTQPIIKNPEPRKETYKVENYRIDFSTDISDKDILFLNGTKLLKNERTPRNRTDENGTFTEATSVNHSVTYHLQRVLRE